MRENERAGTSVPDTIYTPEQETGCIVVRPIIRVARNYKHT
jgi:hypothetical protein